MQATNMDAADNIGRRKNFQVILPASFGQMDFAAYLSSHAFELPVDNVIQAAIELAITGAITMTDPT